MFHYKTRFILQESFSIDVGGYYSNKNYTKGDKCFDYYTKKNNWSINNSHDIEGWINLQMEQIPQYLRCNVLPITLIKRTLYDIKNFFQRYFKLPLNVLNYFLFCLDLMQCYIPNKEYIYVFEQKIQEHLNLTDEHLNKLIELPEYYKKHKHFYQKLFNVSITAKDILYDYIQRECIMLFKSDNLQCLHKHCIIYCDHCSKLTFHLREWNTITIKNEETGGKHTLLTDKCITTKFNELQSAKYFYSEDQLQKYDNFDIKLCDIKDDVGRNTIQSEHSLINYYQCFHCSTKTQTFKLKKNNHQIITNGIYTTYLDFPINMNNIKEILVSFVQQRIIQQININKYLFVRNNKNTLLNNFNTNIDHIICKYL